MAEVRVKIRVELSSILDQVISDSIIIKHTLEHEGSLLLASGRPVSTGEEVSHL